MRHRSLMACGLWLVVALPVATAAAAPRKAAPKKAAPTKAAPEAVTLEETAPAPKEPAPKEPASNGPASNGPAPQPLAPNEPAPQPVAPQEPAPARGEVTELGRREAERIAAGRIQVAVSASVDIGSRHFTYSDAVGSGYAPYRQPVAPMLSFGIEAYPAAASGIPVLRDLGLRGRVSRGFAFDSKTPQGVSLDASWTRFGGELRQRLIVAGAHRLEVGLLAGLDANYFGISADSPVPALLPAANTVALRFGVDGQLLLGWRLSVLLGAAYLLVTSPGEIYEQFREPQVAGVDGDLGLAIGLGSGFEARLNGRYTRYFASFDPQLGDPHVAGGALDQLLQVGLGARYAH